LLRAIERGEAAANQQLIPARSVLIEQQNRFTRVADAGARTRRLNFHQRDEAVDFGFLRREFGKHTAEAERFFAKRRTHPIGASGSRVAFVENQIDHFEHGGKPLGAFFAGRDFERDARFAERSLGADDALGDRFFGNQKCACDFIGG